MPTCGKAQGMSRSLSLHQVRHHRPGSLQSTRSHGCFALERYTPRQVAERLGGEGIFVRD
jgi:hypothetical protein